MSVRIGVIGVGMIGQDHIRRITQVLTGGSVTSAVNVPSISSEDMEALGPFIPLAAKLVHFRRNKFE